MIENGGKESSIVNDLQENKEQDAKVEISDISIALDSVKEVMDKIDPERVAKVQAIKEAIVQGTYKVDSGAIADKILKDSLPNLVED